MTCGTTESRDSIAARLDAGEAIPACRVCGGGAPRIHHRFGEPLPQEPLHRAAQAARRADLFLIFHRLVARRQPRRPTAANRRQRRG